MSRMNFGRWTVDTNADSITTPRAKPGVETFEVYELRLQDIKNAENVDRCAKDLKRTLWLTPDDILDFRAALAAVLEQRGATDESPSDDE